MTRGLEKRRGTQSEEEEIEEGEKGEEIEEGEEEGFVSWSPVQL